MQKNRQSLPLRDFTADTQEQRHHTGREQEGRTAQQRAQNDRQTQNPSVAEAGRDLWRSSAPTPAPARPLNLPAVQLLVGILSLKDFFLYLKSEIQNAAAKMQNLPLSKPLLCCLFQAEKSC